MDDPVPYIVPRNFGFEESGGQLILYFHSAAAGRKMDLIQQQGMAAFELDRKHELIKGETACDYSYRYQSIFGTGTIEIVQDDAEKVYGLQCVMNHYSNRTDWEFRPELLERVKVLKLSVTEWSCKEH